MKTISELLNFSIVNMDKPTGPTSFGVDSIVKRMINASKISHAGTLDPMVTGVLPLMLNRACRLSDYFMHKNKTYVGILRVHREIGQKELEKEIENFIGKIMQLPPVKSRVKREIREREIFTFKILEQDGKDFLFETEVQAGTYIRKLVSDLGDRIGGAHMLELRRTKAGIFSEENIVSLYQFEEAVNEWENGNEEKLRKILIPAEKALEKVLPAVHVKPELVKQLLTGKPLHRGEAKLGKEEKFAVFSEDKFIGIYKKVDEDEIVARAEFVFN
jgi:H/ACA ribonucleoprotein complex subunit 4